MNLFKYLMVCLFMILFTNSYGQLYKPDSTRKKEPFDALWLKSHISSYLENKNVDANDVSAKMNKAYDLMRKDKFEEALGLLQEANNHLVKLQELDRQSRKAIVYYNTNTLLFIALCKEAIYEYDTALIVLEEIKNREPLFKEAYNELGVIYMKKWELEKAKEQFEKAIEMYAIYPDACYNLAYVNFLSGDNRRAKKYAEMTLKLDNRKDIAHLLLALIYEIEKKIPIAEKSYQMAIDVSADPARTYFLRALFLFRQKKYDAALPDLDYCIKKDSTDKTSLAIYANILILQNRMPEGMAMLLKVFEKSKKGSEEVLLQPVDDEISQVVKNVNQGKYTPSETEMVYQYFRFIYALDPPDINTLKQLRDKHSSSFLSHKLYYLTFIAHQQLDQYFIGINNLYSINDTVPNFHMMEALVSVNGGKFNQAIKNITKAILYDSSNAAFNYYMGICKMEMGKTDESIYYLSQCIRYAPAFKRAYASRAFVYNRSGRPHLAINDLYTALAERNDTNFSLCNQLGISYLIISKYDSAMYFYSRAIGLNRNYKEALFNRAELNSRLRKNRLALVDLNKILAFEPKFSSARTLKIKILTDIHQYDSAMSQVNQMIKEREKWPYLYTLKGHIFYAQDKYNEALEQYLYANSLNKEYKTALKYIGLTFKKLNKPDKAKEYFNAAMVITINDVVDYLRIASVCEDAGEPEKAIQYCKRAMIMDSSFSGIYANMGWYLYRVGKYEQCIAYSKKALAMDSIHYNAGYNMALSYLRLNKTEEAKKLYIRFVASEPESTSPPLDDAIGDLKEVIKDGVLVEECRYIIEHILKGKAD